MSCIKKHKTDRKYQPLPPQIYNSRLWELHCERTQVAQIHSVLLSYSSISGEVEGLEEEEEVEKQKGKAVAQ